MKVCIVGGGGGATNAANRVRALNKDAKIDIFTNREEIGNLPCEIPFVLSGSLPSWESSFAFKNKFYAERNIDVHFNTEITEIDREKKILVAGSGSYAYDKAILDLGSVPSILEIEGLDGYNEFFLTTQLRHARIFEQAISKYRNAAIIGVGQIALEIAEVLKAKGYENIYLIGRSDQVLRSYLDKDMAGIVERRIKENQVELIQPAKINKIVTKDGKKILSLIDRDIEIDYIFFAMGADPNTELAKRAGIQLGDTQAINVNNYLQTSDSDIYAIGDCMENWERITGAKIRYQTATNAANTGRIAGKNLISGNNVYYAGTVMPFITECFGYQVGTVGFTEAKARERGLDVVSNITTSSTRRRLFGGKPIDIKLIADRKTRILVGAQLIGEELIAGKVDKLSVAVAMKIPVDQIPLIDTCYSPTTGAGYDALTMAMDELQGRLR
ncbi:MAG: FAD-dependent oxidoreductase [Dehalococcoidia bacterium]|nr:FAD-dependent oxidoreductase [Dehalococcoidia bacterium]